MRKLPEKQQRFVDEYLIDLNATQAAIRAGYSPNTATEQASQLLTKLNIKAHVDAAIADRSKRTGVTQDRVVRELARLAFADPTQVVNFRTGEVYGNLSEDDRAIIAGVKVKDGDTFTEREVKLTDKTRALELLGRHLGMFKDGMSITVDLPKIVDDIGAGGE